MKIIYKKDILQELKSKGLTTYRLRKNKILSETIITKLRNNDTSLTLQSLAFICALLDCQLSDLIEVKQDINDLKKIYHID